MLQRLGLRNIALNLISWYQFFQNEKIYGTKYISLKKINLFRKGFYSIGQIPFDFKKFNYNDFISDVENIKLSYLNYPYGRLLRDKLIFSNYFKNFIKVPEVYAHIHNGRINAPNAKYHDIDFNKLTCLLEQNKLILKPSFGTGGEKIYKIEKIANDKYLLNKNEYDLNTLRDFIKNLSDFIAVEFIEQGKFSAKFYSDSANTLRITTYIDPQTGQGKILYALMRFGRDKSAPADNVGAGGIYSLIDLDTGMLKSAIELKEMGKFSFHDSHPDTSIRIKGEFIPCWDNIKITVIKLATQLNSYIKFAGWDIILTEKDLYLIEGNNGPDLYIQGPDNPLALSPYIKNLLRLLKIR